MSEPYRLYAACAAVAFTLSAGLTPLVRWAAVKLKLYDVAHGGLKTHERPTPALGGVAIWLAFAASLLVVRFLTSFPTGTLRNLRGVLAGGGLLFLLGLLDDLRKPEGLPVGLKFAVQAVAAALLVTFDIRINFLQPEHFALALTGLWVVGVTNAFNLIDIMDGLAASQAAIAAAGFLLLALPSEAIYVNFTAASLLGATLGFLPWNLSGRHKIFMGDGGALAVGFVLAAVSLGTRYSDVNPLGIYAPLVLLGVPIYDTLFVMGLRMGRGLNPFKGSRDHFALRLVAAGLTRRAVVGVSGAISVFLAVCAWGVTHVSTPAAVGIYTLVGGLFFWASLALVQVDMGER